MSADRPEAVVRSLASPEFDVAVIGGGPAGSVCAARLASRGRRVVVLERDRHPRFHLGESLLPNSLGVLEAIGVLDEVRRRFIVKRGARFVDGADPSRSVRYAFAEAFHARWDHAFQVPRDDFDALLFRHAGHCGADLRERWEATRVLWTGTRAAGLEARDPNGSLHTVRARFIVDASGRDAVIARAARDVERIEHLDRTALFTQVRGAWRDAGEREGDIQIVVFGDGPHERGWFWLIPFADGRTSVGAVVSSAWVRARREAGGPEELFGAAVAASTTMRGMLEGAQAAFAPRATADFSFRVRALCGDGWVALGDASGFIDPLFSTGAHLAMHGALHAADAIDDALRSGDVSRVRFESWEREQRSGAQLFVGAVQAFYGGDLVSYLFAEPQHPFLRRAITSLLSGDVFDERARWAREMRERFPVRTASGSGATSGERQ
ncbi:MAG TPA: NAD(P)/FAD-dependent oxidoreductase [Polyangiaceae bacterium]|nr:NAD(P)/FAD-dependent oxidoreductase [Polyangiaceae bacterium]